MNLFRSMAARQSRNGAQFGLQGHERRSDVRYEMDGHVVPFQVGKVYSFLLIKDLSCGGVGGIAEAPLFIGQRIYLELDELDAYPALVRWVDNTSVGLKFVKPLDEHFVLEFHTRQKKLGMG